MKKSPFAFCIVPALMAILACSSVNSVLAQPNLSDPFRLPGDAVIQPAAGSQREPAIARGENSYLVVWSDTRSHLMDGSVNFSGGPFFGVGLGTMQDIYAARLDANGNLLDTTPILIAQES